MTRATASALAALLAPWMTLAAARGAGAEPQVVPPATQEQCALLDDWNAVARMDGLLLYLARACGREAEFLGAAHETLDFPANLDSRGPANVLVNNPLQDTSGTARTQSETSIALNRVNGTLCAAWVDSFHGVTEGTGYSGFGRSTDGGATFDDRGAFPTPNYGDPSMVWRKLNGKFYFAALELGGIGIYRSDTDCVSFVYVGDVSSTGFEDRPKMAVDSTPGSPYNGWLYVAWTDQQTNRIRSSRSANGGAVWSAPVDLPGTPGFVLGAWPAVAPNGDLYVAWLRFGFVEEPIHIDIAKSTDGGSTFVPLPPPMTGKRPPLDAAATGACAKPALRGNIRYRPTPTIAVDDSGFVHVTYGYDPDALYSGDTTDVYYRRSTTGGQSWDAEILVNDDGTETDQWQPSLSVGAGNVVTIGYYSRQLDPVDNLLFDYYSRTSLDGGLTFQPGVRMTESSSSVVHDPNLSACYHGDFDTQTHGAAVVHMLWSDDRDPGCPDCGANANVWTRPTAAGTDFALAIPEPSLRLCAPEVALFEIDVLKFQSFSESVTLAASGYPAGTSVEFSENAQAPPFASILTVGSTEGAPDTTSTITITGTSAPSLIEHSGAAALVIDGAAPPPPALVSPVDLTSGLPERPSFSWSAIPGAIDYSLEIDDDAEFSSPAYQVTVADTIHVPPAGLPQGVVLYWRVRGANSCGALNNSVAFRLAVPAKQLYCRAPNLLIPDRQEDGVEDVLTLPAGDAVVSDVEIDLNVTHGFVGDLSFSLAHEGTQTVFFDRPGSPATPLGCSWNNIHVRANDEGTDGDIESACSSVPGGPAISGDRIGGDPANATLLAAFDGQSVSGEWSLHATDHQGGDVGRLDSWCLVLAGTMPFLDGFESGDTSRWSSTASGLQAEREHEAVRTGR